jgi:competence protein ComFC
MKILNGLFDFFIPRQCPGCNNKLLSSETAICKQCLASIKIAEDERIRSEFERKFLSSKIISGFTSLFVFEKDKPIQSYIHSIKYNKRFLNAQFFGELIAQKLNTQIKNWNIDYLVPVPLHQLRKAERGFNQSKYIASGISKEIDIRVRNNILRRAKYTETQTNLSLTEREKNIADAFKVRYERSIKNKSFLLVDDVITTGATIRECGKALLNAGANKIYACSAAIAE